LEIGRSIAEKQKAGWGKSVVEQLSKDIQIEFPGIKGFGTSNLWYMAQFYIEYQLDTNLQPMVGEISWVKHIAIMTKCKDSQERQFYILATKKYGWTKNVLIHQIELKAYEKYLLGQTNFYTTLPESVRNQAALAVGVFYKLPRRGKLSVTSHANVRYIKQIKNRRVEVKKTPVAFSIVKRRIITLSNE